MRRPFFILLKMLLTLLILGTAAWGAGLLLFRLPGALGILAATGFGLAALAGATGLWTGAPRLPIAYAVLFAGLLGWWGSLQPSHERNWIPELARLPQITREGDRLTVTNLRHFRWRDGTDSVFDERWETRSYDLAAIEGIDLFLTYWSGERIAHLILAFPFAGSEPLAISIEVRREKGEDWAALAGFFRNYELAYVAADERDVIGLRSHARGEDVRLFRLRASPQQARDVLLAYAEDINRLAREPRWYNTLTTNCTTLVYQLVAKVAPGWQFALPLDPRVVLSGLLPGYLKDIGAVRQDLPLNELVRLSKVSGKAKAVPLDSPAFSRAIREGVPSARP